jgi:hypothetical protein
MTEQRPPRKGATIAFVRRLGRVLTVCLLTASFSGAIGMIAPEPCSVADAAGAPDGDCPPTCARCGCCPRPVVPALAVVAAVGIVPPNESVPYKAGLSAPELGEILHVPRSRLT